MFHTNRELDKKRKDVLVGMYIIDYPMMFNMYGRESIENAFQYFLDDASDSSDSVDLADDLLDGISNDNKINNLFIRVTERLHNPTENKQTHSPVLSPEAKKSKPVKKKKNEEEVFHNPLMDSESPETYEVKSEKTEKSARQLVDDSEKNKIQSLSEYINELYEKYILKKNKIADNEIVKKKTLEEVVNEKVEKKAKKIIARKKLTSEQEQKLRNAIRKKIRDEIVATRLYELKEKYRTLFNKEPDSTLTVLQAKTEMLIKTFLNNHYFYYQNNLKTQQADITHTNSRLIRRIAKEGDESLKKIVVDQFKSHLQEHKDDSQYMLAMMNSFYHLRDIGIINDEFMTLANIVGVANTNVWENLRIYALSKIDNYESSFFKAKDRKAEVYNLRSAINAINDSDKLLSEDKNKLSSEDKTRLLIQLLQYSSMRTMETDLKKDKKIGKWSAFSYRNVTGSRYQEMLTDILNKAMPYYISQDANERKENLNDADDLNNLYAELKILLERAELHKVRDNEAIKAVRNDPYLNKLRPEKLDDQKQNLALILERLRLHQKVIEAPGMGNFSRDAFGVSIDDLINRIGRYIKVQTTVELSQKTEHPVFTSLAFELRKRLQSEMHKLADPGYHDKLMASFADKEKKNKISDKYAKQLNQMQDRSTLEKTVVIELMRHLELYYPQAKNIQYVSSSVDNNAGIFVAEFAYEFTDSNNNKKSHQIQISIENFTPKTLKNKTYLVKWPNENDQGLRIVEEGTDEYKPKVEDLFNYCCYAYLKNVAEKTTSDVSESLAKICPDLAEFRARFYDPKDYLRYYNPYHQYNTLYTEIMTKVRKAMPEISAMQRDSQKAKKENKPEFNQGQFNQIEDFIFSFYENDCKILESAGNLVAEKLTNKNPLVRKHINCIYDAFIKSTGTNALIRFFERAAHEYDSMTTENPGSHHQESYYLRGKNVISKNFRPMLYTSIPSLRINESDNESVIWKEIRMGTQAEIVDGVAGVTPFFEAFAEAQARKYPDKRFTHIYFNNLGLDREGKEGLREKDMTLALHAFGERHPNVAVITLPADKGLMSAKMLDEGERDTSEVLNQIIRIVMEGSSIDPNKPTSEVRDFYIPPDVKAELYRNTDELDEINKLLTESIKELKFEDKRTLTGAEAQALYVNFIKFQFTDFVIRKLDPVTLNFTCKDAIDRGAFSALYWRLVNSIKSERGNVMSEREFIRGIHAASALVKGRAMNHHIEMLANSINAFLQGNKDNRRVPEWLKTMDEDRLKIILAEKEKKSGKNKKPSEEIDISQQTFRMH